MPRFIDYALDSLDECNDRFIKKILPKTECIVIENIAEFFYGSEKGFDLSDFPNIAPPFENFLMEHHVTLPDGRMVLQGNLFVSIDCRDERLPNFIESFFRGNNDLIADSKVKVKSSRWMTIVYHGLVNKNRLVVWHSKTVFFTNETGCFLESDKSMFVSVRDSTLPESSILGIVYPSFLAISFMHCKNVTVEQVEPIAKVSKRYEKKTGKPLEKYHVLNIEPMKKVLRTEGDSEKTGLKRALHICRGHFKDFSQGNGLFGKFRGLYWWDSQARGSHQQGIVDKDYNVKTPKEIKD